VYAEIKGHPEEYENTVGSRGRGGSDPKRPKRAGVSGKTRTDIIGKRL